MHLHSPLRRGFTLIELLVVIAIIAVLAVVVVLTLNPAQLLQQSRDANRISDMATLNSAINLYSTDQNGQSGYTLGIASTSYLSTPDSSSTCGTSGLPPLGASLNYGCSSSANYRLASSTGWVPINFQKISSGAPFGTVPVDPVNQTSSDLFYTYETNGSVYETTAFMESQKYAKTIAATGGVDPTLLESGSGAATLPNWGRGLVGYWPFDEGSGTVTADNSGNIANATLLNTPTWTVGKVGSNALQFSSSSLQGVQTPAFALSGTQLTTCFWVNIASQPPAIAAIMGDNDQQGVQGFIFIYNPGSDSLNWQYANGTTFVNVGALNFFTGLYGTWIHTCIVADYGAKTVTFYRNGVQFGATSVLTTPVFPNVNNAKYLGTYRSGYTNGLNGSLDDVRIYNRALSAAEIQEIYYSEK